MASVRWANLRGVVREYLASCSCHGMPYVVHPKLSIVERVCWSVMVVVSLSACIAAIVVGHQRWAEKPIIVSFSPKLGPLWGIPFPAITVCPQTRIDVDRFNVTAVYGKARANRTLTGEERLKMRSLTHVCSTVMRPKSDYYSASGQPAAEDERVVERLINMSIPSDDRMVSCMWSFNFRPCETLWARQVTENGICYSFNMLRSGELYAPDQAFRERRVNRPVLHMFQLHASSIRSTGWTMEAGYTAREDLLAYPRRTASAGFKGGAIVVLKTPKQHREYVCAGALQGFKVTIHAPDEFPRLSEYYIRVPPMQATSIIVRPRLLTTQKSLQRFPPSKRQCYFSDERKLRFFRVYNEQNCEFECLTNYTLATCGCVTFAMPRHNGTRVCGAHEMKCYEGAVQRLMELTEISAELGHESCECLPACTTIKYDVELSTDVLNVEALLASSFRNMTELQDLDLVVLYVYFKENTFLYTERVEYISTTSEMANLGGTLALLAGMSLTSLVEIFYYITMRPLCLWLRARYLKSKADRARRTRAPRHEVQLVYPVRPWIP